MGFFKHVDPYKNEELFDSEPFKGRSNEEIFGDIDESDSADVPVQLIDELRFAYDASDDKLLAHAAKYLLLWVDTH